MIRDTPNFTYEQELACPRCGGMAQKLYIQDSRGRYKRHTQTLRRAESKGPWAADDVLVEATRPEGSYRRRAAGRQWVHKVDLMCSRCGQAGSYANFMHHDFTDEELPYDFWQEPYGTYLPEKEPETTDPAPSGDIYGLDDLF